MSHNVAEAAARAVKNSQRTATETRSLEQILKDIRSNLNQKLFVTPNYRRFLLEQYDAAQSVTKTLREQVEELQTQVRYVEIVAEDTEYGDDL